MIVNFMEYYFLQFVVQDQNVISFFSIMLFLNEKFYNVSFNYSEKIVYIFQNGNNHGNNFWIEQDFLSRVCKSCF